MLVSALTSVKGVIGISATEKTGRYIHKLNGFLYSARIKMEGTKGSISAHRHRHRNQGAGGLQPPVINYIFRSLQLSNTDLLQIISVYLMFNILLADYSII